MNEMVNLEARVTRLENRKDEEHRRLWERINELEKQNSQRIGGSKMLTAIGHAMSAGAGGAITWVATWLSSGGLPHH